MNWGRWDSGVFKIDDNPKIILLSSKSFLN
jgi:hypothetical protein